MFRNAISSGLFIQFTVLTINAYRYSCWNIPKCKLIFRVLNYLYIFFFIAINRMNFNSDVHTRCTCFNPFYPISFVSFE